jgi:hypothetical protein
MNIFSNNTSQETKLDCIAKMIENHIMDLKGVSKQFDFFNYCLVMNMLKYKFNALSKIIDAIEQHDKIILIFDFTIKEGGRELSYQLRQIDGLEWDDFFEGNNSRENGICLSFCFNNDIKNSPWYFTTENQLRGRALAKVLEK